ncbi:hypothetical protein GCM10009610_44940 [Pseudonocardia xinjiangensis]
MVSITEKSSAPSTFAGKTIRPCRFTTNGFIATTPSCDEAYPTRRSHGRATDEWGNPVAGSRGPGGRALRVVAG